MPTNRPSSMSSEARSHRGHPNVISVRCGGGCPSWLGEFPPFHCILFIRGAMPFSFPLCSAGAISTYVHNRHGRLLRSTSSLLRSSLHQGLLNPSFYIHPTSATHPMTERGTAISAIPFQIARSASDAKLEYTQDPHSDAFAAPDLKHITLWPAPANGRGYLEGRWRNLD